MVGTVETLRVELPGNPEGALTPLQAQTRNDEARAAGAVTVLETSHDDAWVVLEWCRLVGPDFVRPTGLTPSEEWAHRLLAIPTRVLRPGEPVPAVF